MLPSKKRRTTVTESPHHQGNQEEGDLAPESAVKPESDQVKDLGSVSLSWGPSHGRAAGLEVQSVPAAGHQLGVDDASLSSRGLSQDTSAPVPEAVDPATSKGLTVPSSESSQPLATHLGKENLQATGSRRGKKMALRPKAVTQEDRGDRPMTKEPFAGEASEEVKEEGGKRCQFLRPCFPRVCTLGFASTGYVFLPAVPIWFGIRTAVLLRVSSELAEWVETFFSPLIP